MRLVSACNSRTGLISPTGPIGNSIACGGRQLIGGRRLAFARPITSADVKFNA